MTHLTISISDELHGRMERFRDRIDISQVCEKALEKETRHLERKFPRERSASERQDPWPPAGSW